MSAVARITYTHDILGNRTWRDWSEENPGATKYNWDAVNRMESYATEDYGAAYKCRADGMRNQKVEGLSLDWIFDEEAKSGYYDEIWSSNQPTTRYFYDGQMSMEEDFTREVDEQIVVDVTRYGIGARGIDFIAKDPYNQSESIYYPIYDGHGNNVGLVSRNGTGFTVSNRRAYDAWGNIRQGSTSGEPKQRYCANLGHVQDDESGLTYMRARYYEPWTGRFVSEDPARDGVNWFIYVENNPLTQIDFSGQEPLADAYNFVGNLLIALGRIWIGGFFPTDLEGIGDYMARKLLDEAINAVLPKEAAEMVRTIVRVITTIEKGAKIVKGGKPYNANRAIMAIAGYTMACYGMLMIIDAEAMGGGGDWFGFGLQ